MDDQRSSSTATLTLEDDSTAWKRPRKVLLILALIFAAGTIILLTTTVVFAVQKNSLTDELEKMKGASSNLCLTEECIKAASRVFSNMNQDRKPCDNFFEYACGGWIKQHVLQGVNDINVLKEMGTDVKTNLDGLLKQDSQPNEPVTVTQVRNFYNSCIDTDTIDSLGAKPLTDQLESLGGWPVLEANPGGNWDAGAFDFEKLWADLRGQYGQDMIIHIGLAFNSTTVGWELAINVPSFVVTQLNLRVKKSKGVVSLVAEPVSEPDDFGRKILLETKFSKERQAYLQYMIDVATSLGANSTAAKEEMTEVLEFETTMSNFTQDQPNLEMTTLGELEQNYGDIDWARLFQLIMPASVNPPVTEDEIIENGAPEYVGQVSRWLKQQDDRVIANYMIWRLVAISTPFLSQQILQHRLKYLSVVRGISPITSTSREGTCVTRGMNYLPYAMGRIYVDEYFSEDAKEQTLRMIGNLQTAFKTMLITNDWLQQEDKGAAAEKADAMSVEIGYPDWIKNDIKLDAFHAGLTFETNEFFNNVLVFLRWNTQKQLARLRENPIVMTLWDQIQPTTVNAQYSQQLNGIVFAAAILQPPVYNAELPWYLNYGGIGMVIGHEITHGFDSEGRKYDKNGNLRVWWSQTSIDKFEDRAQCIVDQYSSYAMPENGRKLNGTKTERENIADNGGLKEAYKAYKDSESKQRLLPGLNMTDDQLFFLSFSQNWCVVKTPTGVDLQIETDPHSPGRYRVIGSLQNNEEFNTAFNCPAGSYMNQAQKCSVW